MAKSKGGNAQNAKNNKMLKSLTSKQATKKNLKNTAIETVKDLAGVVVGGLAGAAIGKPSLYVGIGLTGAGHFTETPLLTSFGVGVMAANGFQGGKTVEGLDGMDMASVKERVNAYKDSFLQKTYIDKLAKKKEVTPKETNGFGNLQFFNAGNEYRDSINGGGYDELAALDSIEQQVLQSGMAHMRNNRIEGLDDVGGLDDIEGFEGSGEYDLSDASDFNL
jgi:hypothetical protein